MRLHLLVLLVVSIIGSILSGVVSTLSFLFFGYVFDDLNMTEIDLSRITSSLVWYASTLVASALFAFLERLLLGYFAGIHFGGILISENVTRSFRKAYVESLLHHDVEYIESVSPGRLGQRFSEESSRIVDGLGPGLGLLSRSLASLVCGLVVGFYFVHFFG